MICRVKISKDDSNESVYKGTTPHIFQLPKGILCLSYLQGNLGTLGPFNEELNLVQQILEERNTESRDSDYEIGF